MPKKKKPPIDSLLQRALALRLYGLVAHWDELSHLPWVPQVIECEEHERKKRSLERRFRDARIGSFKPISHFDWKHPKKIDRRQIDDLFDFEFLSEKDSANVIFLGPNGTGKTMLAKNLAHQAVGRGHTVRFTSASLMLNELAAQDSASRLNRRLRQFTTPELLAIDEVGYLSYDSRHADLLFEVITRRYEQKMATIITTNRPFAQWAEIFPNASCVVALVDRLCHRSEIVSITGDSYRLKEAKTRAATRRKSRRHPAKQS